MRHGLLYRARLMSLLFLLAWVMPAWAWSPVSAADWPGWHWERGTSARLSGASLRWFRFQAPQAPADAARLLHRVGGDRFSRLQILQGHVTLSGLHAGEHWLAVLSSAPGGAMGLVSSLEPRPEAEDMPQELGYVDPLSLLPAGARRVTRMTSQARNGDSVMLASYRCRGNWRDIRVLVSFGLERLGWRTEPGAAGADSQINWIGPAGQRLSVHAHSRAGGVVVTFWHFVKGV